MAPAVLHLSKYPPGRGGMDQVLRLHASQAARDAGKTRLLSLLAAPKGPEAGADPASAAVGRGVGALEGGIYEPLGWLARRARAEFGAAAPAISVYYNCWGADVLAGADPAAVRVGYLHNHFPRFERYLAYYGRFLDGFLSVSPAMHAEVCRLAPAEVAKNSACLPLPVDPRFEAAGRTKSENDRCVIGFCGRIARAQKRVDRLPELLTRLDAAGLDYRLELLGDGPDRAWLAERIGGHPRVAFLGWREPAAVAATLAGWKYLVFTSDYEGQSLALLEGIAAGCRPVYPDFHQGRDLPADAAAGCLYPPGDIEAAAARLLAMERAPAGVLAGLEAALARLAVRHRPEAYLQACDRWAETVRPVERTRRVANWRQALPVFAYNRFYKRLVQG